MDFVLTSDLDWASDYCIENFLALAARYSIRPTIFVTHASAAIAKADRDGRVELGIHPNFLPPSTHGDSFENILTHVLGLVPQAVAVRCHRYLAGPEIERMLAERGLRIDSNACRHLEGGLAPLDLPIGLRRLPVFFEDDFHWLQAMSWRFADHASAFFSPGLKILNFHPFFVALNAPDAAFYLCHKPRIPTLSANEAAQLRHRGKGAGTFLIEALAAIRAAGHRFVTLSELAHSLGHGALSRRTG
jgi:polysaccharide deactylase WbmS-like protein